MPEALVRYRPYPLAVADVVVALDVVAGAAAGVAVAAPEYVAVAGPRQRAETGSGRTPAGCAAGWGQEAALAGPALRRRCSLSPR